jgi:hypothetical protein
MQAGEFAPLSVLEKTPSPSYIQIVTDLPFASIAPSDSNVRDGRYRTYAGVGDAPLSGWGEAFAVSAIV